MKGEKMISHDLLQIENNIKALIGTWDSGRYKYVRPALVKLDIPPDCRNLRIVQEGFGYLFSILFYGARCNRDNQHNIHVYQKNDTLFWGREFFYFGKSDNAIRLLQTVDICDLTAVISRELEEVRSVHDALLQQEYAWPLCENLLKGMGRLENWSIERGALCAGYCGDISFPGRDVCVRLGVKKHACQKVIDAVVSCSSCAGLHSVALTRRISAADDYEVFVKLKKGTGAVQVVKNLVEAYRDDRIEVCSA